MALTFADMSDAQRKKKARELDSRDYASYTNEEKQFLDDLNESKVKAPAIGSALKERGSIKTKMSQKKFEKNLYHRGNVDIGVAKKRTEDKKMNPYILGFLIFVVLGSGIFSIIQAMSSGPIF